MSVTRGKHWSYDDSLILAVFDVKGLIQDSRAFLGYSLETMLEANFASIKSMISQNLTNIAENSGNIGNICLNAHMAVLLYFENVLTPKVLSEAREDEQSIITALFNVPVIIRENPESAIAYYDVDGEPIRI